jgi:hypothetical protein
MTIAAALITTYIIVSYCLSGIGALMLVRSIVNENNLDRARALLITFAISPFVLPLGVLYLLARLAVIITIPIQAAGKHFIRLGGKVLDGFSKLEELWNAH